MFPSPRVLSGCLPCNGQLVAIGDYQALFSIIGTVYGGDGRSTFAIPDMRGVAPYGPTNGMRIGARNVTYNPDYVGNYRQQILPGNLPALSGSLAATITASLKIKATAAKGQGTPQSGYVLGAGGNGPSAADIYVAPSDVTTTVQLDGGSLDLSSATSGGVTVNTGGTGALDVVHPATVFNFFIVAEGLYPQFD